MFAVEGFWSKMLHSSGTQLNPNMTGIKELMQGLCHIVNGKLKSDDHESIVKELVYSVMTLFVLLVILQLCMPPYGIEHMLQIEQNQYQTKKFAPKIGETLIC